MSRYEKLGGDKRGQSDGVLGIELSLRIDILQNIFSASGKRDICSFFGMSVAGKQRFAGVGEF